MSVVINLNFYNDCILLFEWLGYATTKKNQKIKQTKKQSMCKILEKKLNKCQIKFTSYTIGITNLKHKIIEYLSRLIYN